MSYEAAELDRRLAGLIMVGTIEAVQYGSPPRCRVRAGDWVSSWLPWKSLSAGKVRHWCPPVAGEQAMVISPSGDPANGFVLPGFYTDQHHQASDDDENVSAWTFPDGAREHYNHEDHEYLLSVPAGGRIRLQIGNTSLELRDDGTTLTTPKFMVEAPESTFSGKVLIKGLLSFLAGLIGKSSGSGATAKLEGVLEVEGAIGVQGNISASGSIMDGGGNSNHHTH